eukprot:TRINITY_DN1210_c0_g2_i1.p1 TRINITY_DN1210_c0_g2~~TRINITY_DN1210_c0_g2_i1.p1  ORF type:complete len:417 (+),score=61.80 TRINITY_DN1210_c0_g2_i1:81-1253(+)
MASVVVAYGRTQSGKSTTLGKIQTRGRAPPQVGDGDGESVTDKPSVIETEVGLTLDTPGLDDTKLRFSDDEAGRRVAIGVGACNVDRVKFLVFESLANDAMHLRGTLEKLARTFGANAFRASVVIATKADMLPDPLKRRKRVDAIQKIAAQQGLCGVVVWQNESVDDAGLIAQLERLRVALTSFEGIPTTDLEDLRNRQRVRAQRLCDAHPTQTQIVDVVVTERYVEPRSEREPYEVPYLDQEAYTEEYDTPEVYEVPEHRTHTYEGPQGSSAGVARLLIGAAASALGMGGAASLSIGNAVGGLLGNRGTRTHHETVMVQKVRMKRSQRQATRNVKKYRTDYRTETRYDEKVRDVVQQKVVEYRLTVDHFMEQALAEITDEIRQSLASNQ